MSDEVTSTQEALPAIGDAVENAVSGNQIPETTQESAPQATDTKKLEATIKNPKASPQQKKEAVKQLKKIKFQVDGEEYEEEFDPNDEEYLKEQLQFAKVARKRMQEKALIEKDVLKFLDDVKKNPKKALSDPAIGLDLKKFAVQIMEEEIENSKKTPEQLALEKAQEELRQLKELKEQEDANRKAADFERIREQEFERYDILMTQALEKNNFPKNPAVIKRMADYMLTGLNAGKDVSPEDIVPLIREDLKNDYKDILNSMPDDDSLEEFIGKEFVDRIRRKNIAKAKKASGNPAIKAGAKTNSTGTKEDKPKEEKKQNFKSFFGV